MKNRKVFRTSIGVLSATLILFFSSCEKHDSCGDPEPGSSGSSQRNAPTVPAILNVPEGNVVSFAAFATGVQIYVSTETSPGVFGWVFRAPEAELFSSYGFKGLVGTHYAGPTWESNSGSKVAGTRLQGTTVDATAIPWLLLGATSSQGPGVFEGVTYIQRVNTVGGLAPAAATANASNVGQEARIAYTAEYYFFKPESE